MTPYEDLLVDPRNLCRSHGLQQSSKRDWKSIDTGPRLVVTAQPRQGLAPHHATLGCNSARRERK